jgi:hypothetical protein
LKKLIKVAILLCCVLTIGACKDKSKDLGSISNENGNSDGQTQYTESIQPSKSIKPVESVQPTESIKPVSYDDRVGKDIIKDKFVEDLVKRVGVVVEKDYPDIILEDTGYTQDGKHTTTWNGLTFVVAPDYGDGVIAFKISAAGDYDKVYDEPARKKHEQVIKDVIQSSIGTEDDATIAFTALMNKKPKDNFVSIGEYVGKKVHYRLVWTTFDANRPPVLSGALTKPAK